MRAAYITAGVALLGLACVAPTCSDPGTMPDCPAGCVANIYYGMGEVAHWDCDPVDINNVPPGGCPAGH